MARKFNTIAAIVLLGAVCAACTTAGIVDKSAALQGNGDSYFVIGIAPAKTRVFIVDGAVTGGKFERSVASALLPFSATLMNVPQDGFLVGKTHGGTTLGLLTVFDETGWPDVPYSPCDGAVTPVFAPPPGTVVYIASIDFQLRGSTNGSTRLLPKYSDDDLDAARAFLKSHYPNLADKIEKGHYALVPSALPCNAGIP